jgi:HD-GYP domain-containing protein (c-di-GMP phosphodiesterase class II)
LSQVERLFDFLEGVDKGTAIHADGVAQLSKAVARALPLEEPQVEFVVMVALLHDVGKARVPPEILTKPQPLSRAEMGEIEKHPTYGEQLLHAVPRLHQVAPCVRASHERWDGRGYPDGLRGSDIPLPARIVFACDAVDAMSFDRPYRKALPHHQILFELARGCGTQFDPRVAAMLLLEVPLPAPRSQAQAAQGGASSDA